MQKLSEGKRATGKLSISFSICIMEKQSSIWPDLGGETIYGQWDTSQASNGKCWASKSVWLNNRNIQLFLLTAESAYERQAHQSRLRNEIARSKTEQGEYLRNVELARILDKRKARKVLAGDGEDAKLIKPNEETPDAIPFPSRRGYQQRQIVETVKGMDSSGMGKVLNSVFG